MRHLDLFSGIGGFALAARWMGWETVQFVEREPFCRAVLAKHWPQVPCHDDIGTFDGRPFRGRIDLVTGGFPCQPVSLAGRRKGAEDDRWLWPEMLRIVRDVRPAWVVAENTPGLRTLGADGVLADLGGEGYACWTFVVGAEILGAVHRRNRIWIVAHAAGVQPRRQQRAGNDGAGPGDQIWAPERQDVADAEGIGRAPKGQWRGTQVAGAGPACEGGVAADANSQRRELERRGGLLDGQRPAQRDDADGCSGARVAADAGGAGLPIAKCEAVPGARGRDEGRAVKQLRGAPPGLGDWRGAPEPTIRGVDDGLPRRLDRRPRLAALGNAIVPQVAFEIFRAIEGVIHGSDR